MIATLTRTLGSRHLSLAEDAVQDALMTAMQQWPFRGVPDNPEAWLFQVARNRALDRLRHGRMAADKEPAIARESATVESPTAAPLLRDELPPRRRRSTRPAVPHLPSIAAGRRARRAGAEAGRRLQRRRDRARVSVAGSRRSRSGWCAPSDRCATSRSRSACPTPPSSARAPRFRARRALPDVQRRLRRDVRRSADQGRCGRRGDPAGAHDRDASGDRARRARGRWWR